MAKLLALSLLTSASFGLKTRMTKEEVRRLPLHQCRMLHIGFIKNHLDPEACQGFTEKCLDSFDITNLPAKCMASLTRETIQKLSLKSFQEIMSSRPENIFLVQQDIADLLRNHSDSIDEIPETFVEYLLGRLDLAEFFLELMCAVDSFQPINQIMRHVDRLTPEATRYMDVTALAQLPIEIIEKLTKRHFELMLPDALTRITAEQMIRLKPEVFEVYESFTISALAPEHWEAMNVTMIRNLGRNPAEIPVPNSTDRDEWNQQVVERRLFVDLHPCYSFKIRMHKIVSSDVRQAVEHRCQPIWKAMDEPPLRFTEPVQVKAAVRRAIKKTSQSASTGSAYQPTIIAVLTTIFLLL